MKIKCVTLLVLFILGGCQSLPPEAEVARYFKKESNELDFENKVSTARWVADGYLNGSVYTEYPNGMRYFAYVPVDGLKAVQILRALTHGGDEISQALLGILYRNGQYVGKDTHESIKLLKPLINKYSDVSGEYGLALYELLRTHIAPHDKRDEYQQSMLSNLMIAADYEYIPALNALADIFNKGIYATRDLSVANSYRDKSDKLIQTKIQYAQNMADSRKRVRGYSQLAATAENQFQKMTFLISLGTVGALSFGSQSCVGGCNASLTDLRNWGVL